MAMAVDPQAEARKGRQLTFVFFSISFTVLVMMVVLMWKDTHPEWLTYQRQFKRLERRVLEQKRSELLAALQHPDYEGDYQRAQRKYLDVKSKSDAAASALEATEADLEELELRAHVGNEEPTAEDGGSDAASLGTKPGGVPASKSELDDLDKEFGAKASPKNGSEESAGKTAPDKASEKELSDLDKEFEQGKAPSKKVASKQEPSPTKSKDEQADLDKEFDQADFKSKPSGAKPPTSPGSKELDDLDKEFATGSKSKAEPPQTAEATATTTAAATQTAYEEASLSVDQAAARAKLEAARRDLLIAERTHGRELLGLPEDAQLKRQLSDERLKEAQQSLDVAETGLSLEDAKAVVKAAAQIARWAADTRQLESMEKSGQLNSLAPADIERLNASKASLDAHTEDQKRDLRTIEGRLNRNRHTAPEVEQIIVDRLGATDRCTTCHRGVEEAGFENAPEPFRTHAADVLRNHPIERFGCVSCHGGWGTALTKEEAHGGIIGKGKPLLASVQIQASCGKCHGDSRQLTGEETFLAGSALFKNSGCLGCHKVDISRPGLSTAPVVQGALPKVGPDLDRVAEKLRPGWLVGWLENPQSHSLDARMPNLGLAKTQSEAIATFLLTQNGGSATPLDEPPPADPTALAAGKHLYDGLGCSGCHTLRGEGMAIGPELTNIRSKVSPKWLYGWIQNPKAYFPNSRMPVFNLTAEQCEQIGNYLLSISDGRSTTGKATPDLADARARQLGASLVAERGCAGCHDIKGFERISAPDLTGEGDKTADVLEFGNARVQNRTLYNYLFQKISDPGSFDTDKVKGKMPQFGLAKNDAQTIAIFLMSLSGRELPPEYTKDLDEQSAPLAAGRRIFEQHDCGSCHRLSGQGGRVGPDLTREGEMVRPSWMFDFLKQPTRIRWWQDARMPNYHLTNQEATTLTEFFMSLSNQPAPYEYTPTSQRQFPLAAVGAKYFLDLKCQSCHPLAGKQGVAGGDTKKLGPDLGLAPTRLKKDWMFRFLKDPQGFSPGTQMPTFNKPDFQYQAIVDYLMKQKPT